MGRRYLSLALLTEGASDQWFLVPLIDRQIADLALRAPSEFDYSGVVTGECFTVAPRRTVVGEVAELLRYFDAVVVHHDHNERGKVDAVREHFAEEASRIVGLVPVRETEAWMLADTAALRAASPAGWDAAWELPHDVEKAADPKALLRTALGGRRDPERDFDRLGQTVELAKLGKVASYQRWLSELRTAMEKLHFL
ncbi:DUF4276 family protein [Streptomyces xinghaiensis]|uniref:DUF4276 family protein n=1 Tax=Streptomyces xinghaiensis TaxID=1038928 RepID=UPI00031B8112|nr:DUF4276 family protein [Streptomyces xinghaiensis]